MMLYLMPFLTAFNARMEHHYYAIARRFTGYESMITMK